MIRLQHSGVAFYRFETLSTCDAIVHAVFTRIGGTSSGPFHSLNVGQLVGDVPAAVRANCGLILSALGTRPERLVTARQVHGAHVAMVGTSQCGSVMPATDGLISQTRGVALLLRFADCLPLMLYDPRQQAIGLVHIGWRGCLAGAVPNTLAAMQRAFSSDPRDLLAGLGPAIGPCCYQVKPDLIASVEQTRARLTRFLLEQPDGSVHFDLPSSVRSQLRRAGVQSIEDSGLCTCCHQDEFFSHRGERGRTGRFAVVLALRE
jgi:hypothetical protein